MPGRLRIAERTGDGQQNAAAQGAPFRNKRRFPGAIQFRFRGLRRIRIEVKNSLLRRPENLPFADAKKESLFLPAQKEGSGLAGGAKTFSCPGGQLFAARREGFFHLQDDRFVLFAGGAELAAEGPVKDRPFQQAQCFFRL